MNKIFLESHHIKNLNFGFGQFNYQLIKGLYNAQQLDINITLHVENKNSLSSEFGEFFNYKKYYSLRRYPAFRIREKFNLWHSLNQNTKVEPYSNNIPYLLTIHDVNFMEEDTGESLKKRMKLFEDKLNRSDEITYISNYAKAMTHTYFDVPKVKEHIIYNGNPVNTINVPDNYTPKIVSKKPFIFSIGEFLEKKNFHTLIEMLQYLPEINLILSGKNNTKYAEKIQETISKLRLGNNVYITGKISELDKNYFYKNCLAFVFPSLREGFGIPPIEAMSYGKPVFLSNKSSLPEIGGQYAFYWDNFQPDYMAQVFNKGMNTFANEKGTLQLKIIEHANSYSWDETAKKYLNIYRSLFK